jgi:hypothetical protein
MSRNAHWISVITKHGKSKHPIYGVWKNARARCSGRNNRWKKWYYDLGIRMCSEWDDFQKFFDYLIPTWSPGLTLDRIDNTKGYEPGNVRWATWHDQKRNRSDNHKITHNGVTKVIADWNKELGGSDSLIKRRLKRGWSESDAVTIPADKRFTGKRGPRCTPS